MELYIPKDVMDGVSFFGALISILFTVLTVVVWLLRKLRAYKARKNMQIALSDVDETIDEILKAIDLRNNINSMLAFSSRRIASLVLLSAGAYLLSLVGNEGLPRLFLALGPTALLVQEYARFNRVMRAVEDPAAHLKRAELRLRKRVKAAPYGTSENESYKELISKLEFAHSKLSENSHPPSHDHL